jgi:excinuclease ABC subunit C
MLNKPENIPNLPGVYKFIGSENRVLYVGKAKNLNKRIKNYFMTDKNKLHGLTKFMIDSAKKVEWTIVRSEIEALTLEWEWIQKYSPKYNIIFKDDKSYPYLIVSEDKVKRIFISRSLKYKAKYYGPYLSATLLRKLYDVLQKEYGVRTCTKAIFLKHKKANKPCLKYHINRCKAPCVNYVSTAKNNNNANLFVKTISKPKKELVNNLKEQMIKLSENKQFEEAEKIKETLIAIDKLAQRNSVIFSKNTNFDLFAFMADSVEAVICVFSIRNGLVQFQKMSTLEKSIDFSSSDLLTKTLLQFYKNVKNVPSEIITWKAVDKNTHRLLEGIANKKINIHTAKKGAKRMLYDSAIKNASDKLKQIGLKRVGNLTNRSKMLIELKDKLNMKTAPLRIECYDISHLQGKNTVGSMIVFEDGMPQKSAYRHFVISKEQNNDVLSIKEVLYRRFTHKETDEKKRFSYKPNLIVIDGGAPQVNAADEILKKLNIKDITVCSLAKRNEEVILPHTKKAVIISDDLLLLFMRIRDEAHRFAITHNRKRRETKLISP